jgi:putative CocE/NonD family hydrolase
MTVPDENTISCGESFQKILLSKLRTELDEQTIFYETEPLDTELEVTGHPVVDLWVSANQPDADVFVYLSDVAPDGTANYITEGQLRAGFHIMQDPKLQTQGLRPVRPELPWHGFRAGDYDANAFADDHIVNLRFDLQPTSWVFTKGHRIRISIAGADAGNFELHPDLCATGVAEQCSATTLTLHRGIAYQSRIELPVIPLS